MDTLLTNNYNYGYQTNRGGLAYRFKKSIVNLTAGMDYQNSNLDGSQIFPKDFRIDRQFNNFLPNAMIRFNFSQNVNLQFVYRTSTNSPSISQLQSVIDNSYPTQLTTGNPDLIPQYTHNILTRFSFTNPVKSTNFFAFISGGITQDAIVSSTLIAKKDTILAGNIVLKKGSQLTSPINIGTVKSARSFFVFGFPIKPIKCNVNLNTGLSWSQSPGMTNAVLNMSNTYSLNQGIVLSSNISENVDFIGSYGANYNIVNNSERPDLNDNYMIQSYSFKTNILLFKGIAYETDFSGNKYTGLANKFNQSVFLWNMGLGYKFLKNKNAELRINANNLLNKNNSVLRTVTASNITDQTANTLGRYFMLVFTFNLRNFAAAPNPPSNMPPGGFPFRRPDGGDNRFAPN
jgi:outer membrane receptor protein involved in Fe transport